MAYLSRNSRHSHFYQAIIVFKQFLISILKTLLFASKKIYSEVLTVFCIEKDQVDEYQ